MKKKWVRENMMIELLSVENSWSHGKFLLLFVCERERGSNNLCGTQNACYKFFSLRLLIWMKSAKDKREMGKIVKILCASNSTSVLCHENDEKNSLRKSHSHSTLHTLYEENLAAAFFSRSHLRVKNLVIGNLSCLKKVERFLFEVNSLGVICIDFLARCRDSSHCSQSHLSFGTIMGFDVWRKHVLQLESTLLLSIACIYLLLRPLTLPLTVDDIIILAF